MMIRIILILLILSVLNKRIFPQNTTSPSGKPTLHPSSQPSSRPSSQPSSQPSVTPSSQPSASPSSQPSVNPSSYPTSQPTNSNTTRVYPCGDCGFSRNGVCGFRAANTLLVPDIKGFCNYSIYSTFLVLGANITVKDKGHLLINVQNFTLINGGSVNADLVQIITNSSASINDGNIYSRSIQMYAKRLSITNGIVKGYDSQDSCITTANNSGLLSCNSPLQLQSHMIPNSVILISSISVELNSGASIFGSFVLACSRSVIINSNGLMSTTGLGCQSQGNCNGVGGGNCGLGGSTATCPVGGEYGYCSSSSSAIWPAGKGGTCPPNIVSNGGGIIVVYGSNNIALDGIIESNGQNQDETPQQCGGGAGGAVVINTTSLIGSGSILASGGNVTYSSNKEAGAGGGGFISISNPSNSSSDYSKYNSTTYLTVAGGIVQQSSNQQSSNVIGDGGTGNTWLPICPISYGNSNVSNVFQFCQFCQLSYFSATPSSLPCTTCEPKFNGLKLIGSHFASVEYSSGAECAVSPNQCCYTCNQGYLGTHCINQFDYFLQSDGGIAAIALVVISLLASVLYAIKYHFYDKKRKWLKTKEDDFISKVLYGSANFAIDLSDNNSKYLNEKLIVNPLLHEQMHDEMSTVEKPRYSPRLFLKGKITHIEIQLAWRLHDHDLPYHACRVNLIGSNELLDRRGGQWRLPSNRPVCLRPMLRKEEYERFANNINNAVRWHFFSLEALILLGCFLINPFFSLYIHYVYKKRRAHKLLQLIAEYNHECFRSYKQRENKNSLRIGISPDCSLAYIDFLCDKKETKQSRLPLCPIGQPALPVSVVFSGIGSFFSPYTVDSNDVLVQAICDNDLVQAFIDGSWVNFIADLNKHLRTIQRQNLYDGIELLLQFLNDPKTLEPLGGLVINLCSFPNDVNSVPEEIDYAKDKYKTKIIDEKAEDVKADDTSTDFDHRNSINRGRDELLAKMKNFIDIGNNQNLEEFDNIDKYSSWTEENDQRVSRIYEDYDNNTHKNTEPIRIDDLPSKLDENNPMRTSECIEKSINLIANTVVTIFGSFYGGNDDIGSNYADLISSLLKGQSKLGIIITHGKAVNNKIQFNNIDYISDLRNDYDADSKVFRISSPVSKTDVERESRLFRISKSRKSITRFSEDIVNRDTELSVYKPPGKGEIVRDLDAKAAAQLYGDKAEEISKYYNIVFKAEENLDDLDRKSDDKNGFSLFQKKIEKIQPKADITYEQFMNRPFFISDNLADEEIEAIVTGIGKEIPQNIMHLKGKVPNSLISEIVSLQYNNVLFFAPSGYQCPSALMWEGNKLQELSCSPLDCFLSSRSRVNSPINLKDSPESIRSRTVSRDSSVNANDHIISILHRPDVENLKEQKRTVSVEVSINDEITTTLPMSMSLSADKSRMSTVAPSTLKLIKNFVINPICAAILKGYYFLGYLFNYAFLGVNILPYGDAKYVFPLLRVLVFLTSIIEGTCLFFISTFYIHIWNKSSSKLNSTALFLVLTIPPGAIFLNPTLGVFTGLIGQSPALAKIYSAFSRSASISTLMVLMIYVIKHKNLCSGAGDGQCIYGTSLTLYNALPCGFYVFAICVNKAAQLLITDLYVSHVENQRLSRTWDGLTSSLTPTTDTKI